MMDKITQSPDQIDKAFVIELIFMNLYMITTRFHNEGFALNFL